MVSLMASYLVIVIVTAMTGRLICLFFPAFVAARQAAVLAAGHVAGGLRLWRFCRLRSGQRRGHGGQSSGGEQSKHRRSFFDSYLLSFIRSSREGGGSRRRAPSWHVLAPQGRTTQTSRDCLTAA